MSENVQIALIIAVTLIVVAVIFRKRLSTLFLKAGAEGVEAKLEAGGSSSGGSAGPSTGDSAAGDSAAGDRPGVSIRGVQMTGSKQEIAVEGSGAEIEDTRMKGKEQKISVDTRGEAPAGD